MLAVSVDYLIYDDVPRNEQTAVHDVELFERCMQAQQMPEEDRVALRRIIDALLASREAERFAQTLTTRRKNAAG